MRAQRRFQLEHDSTSVEQRPEGHLSEIDEDERFLEPLGKAHTIADLYVERRYSDSHDQRTSEPASQYARRRILYQGTLRMEWPSGPAFILRCSYEVVRVVRGHG